MLFNSLQFFVFFVIVYSLYLLWQGKRVWQNRLLLIASYVFYAAWDWRFLSLIMISTILDYFCGLKIEESESPRKKKAFLLLSLIGNLSILGFFKYFNFFILSSTRFVSMLGFEAHLTTFQIILPLGISFYTLQSLSYTIDIYRKGLKPTRQFLDFALFVTFFPQLVAGPIERARNLLPQMLNDREVTRKKFYEGCFLIFWGLFMKVFIADNLALVSDRVFGASPPYNGVMALLATYAFTFQIFCDFAGYSSMARGLGKCMGFDIMLNFNLPYLTTNIQDFWNKWHISLSTWVRDYLYVPLFFAMRNANTITRIAIALMVTMGVMGLWHGASWVFIAWGLYHGVLLVGYMLIKDKVAKWVQPKTRLGKGLWFWTCVIFTFHLVSVGMLIFRAKWGGQAYALLRDIVFHFEFTSDAIMMAFKILFFTWILFVVQLWQFYKKDLLCMYRASFPLKVVFYFICIFLMVTYGWTNVEQFIYFQF